MAFAALVLQGSRRSVSSLRVRLLPKVRCRQQVRLLPNGVVRPEWEMESDLADVLDVGEIQLLGVASRGVADASPSAGASPSAVKGDIEETPPTHHHHHQEAAQFCARVFRPGVAEARGGGGA